MRDMKTVISFISRRPWLRIFGLALLSAGIVWLFESCPGRDRDHDKRERNSLTGKRNAKLAADLDRDIDTRRRREIMREYRRILDRIDYVDRRGVEVGDLRGEMPRVLRLMREGRFRGAKMHLSTINMRIPREREKVKLPDSDKTIEDMFPGIKKNLVLP